MSINGIWKEGTLPSVGAECEGNFNEGVWVKGVIVAHVKSMDRGTQALIQCDGTWFARQSPKDFRPLRSERDVAIDEVCKDITERFQQGEFSLKEVAEFLIDAGYKK